MKKDNLLCDGEHGNKYSGKHGRCASHKRGKTELTVRLDLDRTCLNLGVQRTPTNLDKTCEQTGRTKVKSIFRRHTSISV